MAVTLRTRLPDARSLPAGGRLGSVDELAAALAPHRRWLVITGAGCSTASGIPDYRDAEGLWKGHRPMLYREFVGSLARRRRYWARSAVGWTRVRAARPNPAHDALAALEAAGRVELLVTQNVDGLHGAAGSRRVLELHGSLHDVVCLACGERRSRDDFQQRLTAANAGWDAPLALDAPDGDAQLEDAAVRDFTVPDCERCGGIMKPDVVFFGETVPAERPGTALAALARADALVIVGSSLAVMSGYRFARAARVAGTPVFAINIGCTRADPELVLRVAEPCEAVLPRLAAAGLVSEHDGVGRGP